MKTVDCDISQMDKNTRIRMEVLDAIRVLRMAARDHGLKFLLNYENNATEEIAFEVPPESVRAK